MFIDTVWKCTDKGASCQEAEHFRKVTRVATLADVARKAGVSKTAVANVLRKRSEMAGVGAETRQRILEIVRELNYRPHPVAASLRTRRTRTIGLLLESDPVTFFRHPNNALNFGCTVSEAAKLGYQVSLLESSWRSPIDARLMDGCMLLGWVPTTHVVEVQQLAARMPVLSVSRAIPGTISVRGSTDPLMRGLREAANYLYDLGHRRLAVVDVWHPTDLGHPRVDAFRDVAAERNLNVELMACTDRWQEREYPTAAEIARLNPLPTAVVAQDDDYARVLIAHLARRRLRVPEDVSVFSGHTRREDFQSEPPLTGLVVDSVAQSREIIRRFIEMVASGSRTDEMVLPPLSVELIERRSCAAPGVRNEKVSGVGCQRRRDEDGGQRRKTGPGSR